MKNFAKLAVLGAAVAIAAPFASATPITITSGQSFVSLSGATTTAPSGATTTLTDSGAFATYPPALPPDYTASYTETAYQGGSGALCPTCWTFAFQISNSAGDALESASFSNVAGMTTEVGYLTDGSVAPTLVSDSGPALTFYFTLPAGTTASPNKLDTILVYTNAQFITPANLGVDNTVASNSPDLGPALTPEPSSLVLMGSGLLSAGGMLFRRRKLAA